MASSFSRRNFIKKLTVATSVLQLSSCATLDDYLFDDDVYLKNQVPIIGGGISGLYLAQLLRRAAIEPRVYEGSSRLGGRILSNLDLDLGASLFLESDTLLRSLIKDFGLTTESMNKKQFFVTGGAEKIITELGQRVAGLIPARSIRIKNQLIGISKIGSYYELDIQTPQGRKTYVSQRVALAIPPSQWRKVDGLLKLDEMSWANFWLEQMQTEQVIRLLLKGTLKSKEKILSKKAENYSYVLVSKKNGTEADLVFPQGEKISLDVIQKIISEDIKMNLLDDETSSLFNWQEAKLIQGAYFKSKMAAPNQAGYKVQVLGDFLNLSKPNTVEGALLEATRAAENLI